MYDPITIFLIVWGLFFVDFFLRLRFLPREIPLAFVVKLLFAAEFSQFLLVWKAFDFSIKSEGQSCWVKYSWLQVLSFHHFEYIVPFPFGL